MLPLLEWGIAMYNEERNEHVNIFATKNWQAYDYQADLANDLELSELQPVGKEMIDDNE